VELSLVETGESVSDVKICETLGSWATGNLLTDKFYDPDNNFSEVSIDFTTEGFDEAKLVRIGELAVQAA
jgi:hypothetical protein